MKIWKALVGTIALGVAAEAAAVPVTFDLGASDVSVSNFEGGWLCDLTGCGASVSLNPNLGNLSATLSAGQNWTFNFFSIRFYGLGGGAGDLSASLGFDAPTGAPNASGSGIGEFFTAFIFSAGNLLWTTQPGSFSLADGTSYSVLFENLSGIALGNDVNVRARLTLNTEPGGPVVGVPEPGALGLLGLGLLAIGFAARRRTRARGE